MISWNCTVSLLVSGIWSTEEQADGWRAGGGGKSRSVGEGIIGGGGMLNVGSVCGLRWLVINGTTFKDAGSGSVESDENEGSDP